jgi:adenylate cyclase class 2
MSKEIEARYLNVDVNKINDLLEENNFKCVVQKFLMKRKTFGFYNISEGEQKWGRVRQEYDKITMAIKKVTGTSIHDVQEWEVIVNDFDKASEFFVASGAYEKSYQENTREIWKDASALVEVSIDTWPMLNTFVEIEAATEKLVISISKKLGLDIQQAIYGGVDIAYEKCLGIDREKINTMKFITFDRFE